MQKMPQKISESALLRVYETLLERFGKKVKMQTPRQGITTDPEGFGKQVHMQEPHQGISDDREKLSENVDDWVD